MEQSEFGFWIADCGMSKRLKAWSIAQSAEGMAHGDFGLQNLDMFSRRLIQVRSF